MMRSMYAAVSGLRTHQLRMDVIGNNIANVNTAGFKKSRAVFKDAFYQAIRGGSAPTDARGGTNPQAIGLGVGLSSVDTIVAPGSAQPTGKDTDMAIDGNGYFILNDGGTIVYSRAGAFEFDAEGNLVNTSGLRVMGYLPERGADGTWAIDPATGKRKIAANLVPIDIAELKSTPPKATTTIKFAGNFDAGMEVSNIIDTTEDEVSRTAAREVYDSKGTPHNVHFKFEKIAAGDGVIVEDGESINGTFWRVMVATNPEFEPVEVSDETGETEINEPVSYCLFFDQDGRLRKVKTEEVTEVPSSVSDWDDPGAASFEIKYVNEGAESSQPINLDFRGLTQYDTSFTGWPEYQDGYTAGELRSFSVDQNGMIMGVYSNGVVDNLARVALATFYNPAGLQAMGGNLYQETNNSGDRKVGAPGEEAMGVILPSNLEMSNVDLSEEFTDMIVTQRGFQANSRIITTSDEMLQELVNLKR
ncbi:MAG: flagellar hook protein FlgE [Syntrophothermaceae bacterium]|jgi:flagellar hook protein FlgE